MVLRGGVIFSFYCKELFLAPIHGSPMSAELARYGECRAIRVALLFFLVIGHRQIRVVSRRHLPRLESYVASFFVLAFATDSRVFR